MPETFQHSILYYHDVGSDERINFGLIIYSQESGNMLWYLEPLGQRASAVFPWVAREDHTALIKSIGETINRFDGSPAKSLELADLMKSIFPDNGLATRYTDPNTGITESENPGEAFKHMLETYLRVVEFPGG